MRIVTMSVVVLTLAAIAGCNQAKSPEAVQRDVDRAAASGDKSIARAQRREERADASAGQDAASTLNRDTDKAVTSAVDTALARAEANHKVALAQCEGYTGEQQQSCKAQADAAWDNAKVQAKAIKSQE